MFVSCIGPGPLCIQWNFHTSQRECFVRACVSAHKMVVNTIQKFHKEASERASQSIPCYGNLSLQIWESGEACEGRARVRVFGGLGLVIARPWTITQIRASLEIFLFPKYFCVLVLFAHRKVMSGVWAHEPDYRAEAQSWPGLVRQRTVVIPGPVSSYRVFVFNTLRNETGFLSVDSYEANGVGGCVHAGFPEERCSDGCSQSWVAVGNSLGSGLKIQLACWAKPALITVILPYWQRLQG